MESPYKTQKPNVCVCVHSCVVAAFRGDKCTHIHTSFSKKEGSQTLSGLSSQVKQMWKRIQIHTHMQ